MSGVATSVLLALLAAVIGGLAYRFHPKTVEVFGSLISINAMLIVLDLLPIPPLPGGLLLRHWGVISEERFWQIARWSGLVLLIAINIPFTRGIFQLLIGLAQLPFALLFEAIAA